MVTGSKKPKAAEQPVKVSKPKVAAKPKPAAKPKAAAKPKPAAKSKAAAKPVAKSSPEAKTKATSGVTVKTTGAVKAPAAARKVGEMMYNDELLESLAEVILSGHPDLEPAAPEIRKQLFDYDIYMVSFLTDAELADIAQKTGKGSADGLLPALTAIRDNARIFVDIASKYNSVRAFIDRMIEAEGKAAGIEKLKIHFDSIKPHPAYGETFLLLF